MKKRSKDEQVNRRRKAQLAPRTSEKPKPGPSAETIKIESDWEAAVGKALEKKKPKGGWPR
jgi:hypothetical protein